MYRYATRHCTLYIVQMKAICFDIEATDRGEMLELSMFSYSEKKEAYHSYYKPVKSKEWKTTEAIHHITPAMVADAPRFASERSKVQELIDACELIVGFAIDNDLRYLRGAGVNIPEKKPVLDVRDLVYMVKGKECDLRYGTVPSLSKCAQMAGLDFTEESDAHSATNDTLATLDLLDALLQASGHKLDARLLNDLDACLEEAREEQLRLSARGVLRLVPAPGGVYKIKNNHLDQNTPPLADGELAIQVDSRYLAEHELRTMFDKRQDKGRPMHYILRKADIDRFLGYKNVYNPVQELVYRNKYGPRRYRNHLDFDVK